MRFSEKLRQAWDDLFYSALVSRLEEDLLRVRQDFEARIQEYQSIVADLRNEKAALTAKCAIFEFSVNQKVGIDPSQRTARKPSFAAFAEPRPMSPWQVVQAEHENQLAKEAAEEETKKVTV
jgi:hypothetical protein